MFANNALQMSAHELSANMTAMRSRTFQEPSLANGALFLLRQRLGHTFSLPLFTSHLGKYNDLRCQRTASQRAGTCYVGTTSLPPPLLDDCKDHCVKVETTAATRVHRHMTCAHRWTDRRTDGRTDRTDRTDQQTERPSASVHHATFDLFTHGDRSSTLLSLQGQAASCMGRPHPAHRAAPLQQVSGMSIWECEETLELCTFAGQFEGRLEGRVNDTHAMSDPRLVGH